MSGLFLCFVTHVENLLLVKTKKNTPPLEITVVTSSRLPIQQIIGLFGVK